VSKYLNGGARKLALYVKAQAGQYRRVMTLIVHMARTGGRLCVP
jgi:hypothetical protein